MMNKTRTVPFDITKAKNGAKVVTRAGNPVRIKHFNGKINPYTVVASIEEYGIERTLSFTELGQHDKCRKSKYDLFIEEEVENDSKNQDETMRKTLISYFQSFPYNSLADSGINAKDAVAWLEKQGEQETLCDKCKKSQPSHSCQDITALGRCAVEHEQKTADNNSKFKVGDWVVIYPGCNAHQIKVVENTTNHPYGYGYDTVDGYSFNDIAEGVRLWNIKDAKDGDVLAIDWKDEHGHDWQKIVIFKSLTEFGVEGYGNTFKNKELAFEDESIPHHSNTWTKNLHPATKEQCDTLFQKIKEAGYEWNSDTKELKKIDADTAEKNIKTRRMTHQELAWWLRDHPEEHRELKMSVDDPIVDSLYYYDNETNVTVNKDIIIRRNGGEWMEPLTDE